MTRGFATAATVVLAGFLLAGCAAGGAGPAASEQGSDPGATSTTPPSADVSGGASIPETYPRDEVPLVDGEPVFAVDLGTGWTVILATDDLAAGFADAAERLEAAGFTAQSHTAADDGEFSQYTDADYTVNLTAATDPTYGKVISYTVVIAG